MVNLEEFDNHCDLFDSFFPSIQEEKEFIINNYRPFSKTFAEIFINKQLINKQFVKFIYMNDVLVGFQYGKTAYEININQKEFTKKLIDYQEKLNVMHLKEMFPDAAE